MQLQIGRQYVARNGEKVTITGLQGSWFIGDDSCLYKENGMFFGQGKLSPWDLMELAPSIGGHMSDVLAEVFGERVKQDAKWGQQDHSPSRWLSILGEEHGEVCRAVCEALANPGENAAHWANYREELIQLAAVAVSMVECFDRNNEETK